MPDDTIRPAMILVLMKSLIAVLLIFTALTTAAAQTGQRVTLELGNVTVWLGMPKVDVLSACAAAGYTAIENKDDGSINILTGTTKAGRLYSVRFTAGRVSYAGRSWSSNGKDELDAVLGALATLDGKNCTVSHEPTNEPDTQLNRVLIVCGSRSVLIVTGKISGIAVADVFERIQTP